MNNLNKIHTTPMGEKRIKDNLNLTNENVVTWCKDKIFYADLIMCFGYNF